MFVKSRNTEEKQDDAPKKRLFLIPCLFEE
jgi:hypothetical protein